MAKYLDLDGLRRVWSKIDSKIDSKIGAVSNGSLVIKLQTCDSGGGYRVI